MVDEKIDPLAVKNPEDGWQDVIRVNKINLKKEEDTINQYQRGLVMLKEKNDAETEGLGYDLFEIELIKKLYPEHGEEYNKTQDWKEHMAKKFAFMLVNMKKKKKHLAENYKLQVKAGYSSISQAQQQMKIYQKTIKEAKVKKAAAIKDSKSYVG